MRDTVVDKRILKLNKNIHPNKKSTKILFKLFFKVPSIRPNLLCPKTQIEQVCHHQTTISSPSSSSSTSLSYLCSTTTNDSQNKKLEEEEKINERFNDDEQIKNSTKNRSNSFGHIQKGKSKEHLLIHQNTENNELPTTSSPQTWTATFAQSLQIRSSSTRRRIRSPRPPAKHILILKRKFFVFNFK